MFLVSVGNLSSEDRIIFKGKCEICGGVEGTYVWITDSSGNKSTVFLSDDGDWGIVKKGEHTTFITGGTGGGTTLPPNIAEPIFITTQSEITVETNTPVIVKLINISTGRFISEDIYVDQMGISIDISDLPIGVYGVAIFQNIPNIGRINTGLHMFYK